MPIHIAPSVAHTDSTLVADIQVQYGEGHVGAIGSYSVTFRPSTRLESLADSLRNFFIWPLFSFRRKSVSMEKVTI